MKKQLLFLMLLAGSMLAFTGCSKDDDENDGSIEGTWKSTKEVYYATKDGVKFGEEEVETFSDSRYNLLIVSGGKYSFKEYYDGEVEDTDEGDYTYSNGNLVIDGDNSAKVKLSGNTMVLTSVMDIEADANINYIREEHYVRQ